MKTVIVLPDGRKITSGDPTVTAVRSCTVTRRVNEGRELTPGSCCAAMLEAELLLDEEPCPVRAGDELTVLWGDQVRLGMFTAEKPEQTGKLCRITAYDRIVKLDRDMTQWLNSLDGWPYPLAEFTEMLCRACGLTVSTAQMQNRNFPVQRLSFTGITARQLLRWAAELGCCFCRADSVGTLQMQWYTPSDQVLQPGGQRFYYENSLKFSDYTVQPVGKVQIQQDSSDVGAIWPDSPKAENTLKITGNLLAAGVQASVLQQAAREIWERLRHFSYTPCSVTVPLQSGPEPGQILSVTAPDGRLLCMPIMEQVQRDFRLQLSCTGSLTRDSVSAVNHRSFQSVNGKLLHLQTDLDGIRAENRDMQGSVTAMELDLAGIRTTVRSGQEQNGQQIGKLQQEQTKLSQDAGALALSVEKIQKNGTQQVITETGYRFDREGLHIRRAGQEIENRMDNTGMYVGRGGVNVLSAGAHGVRATDLQAENYLIIGEHSRLEDYSDGIDRRRTACFSI